MLSSILKFLFIATPIIMRCSCIGICSSDLKFCHCALVMHRSRCRNTNMTICQEPVVEVIIQRWKRYAKVLIIEGERLESGNGNTTVKRGKIPFCRESVNKKRGGSGRYPRLEFAELYYPHKNENKSQIDEYSHFAVSRILNHNTINAKYNSLVSEAQQHNSKALQNASLACSLAIPMHH